MDGGEVVEDAPVSAFFEETGTDRAPVPVENPGPLTSNQEHDPSNGIKGGKRASTAMSLKSERPVNS